MLGYKNKGFSHHIYNDNEVSKLSYNKENGGKLCGKRRKIDIQLNKREIEMLIEYEKLKMKVKKKDKVIHKQSKNETKKPNIIDEKNSFSWNKIKNIDIDSLEMDTKDKELFRITRDSEDDEILNIRNNNDGDKKNDRKSDEGILPVIK